jgi:hypothetical protein
MYKTRGWRSCCCLLRQGPEPGRYESSTHGSQAELCSSRKVERRFIRGFLGVLLFHGSMNLHEHGDESRGRDEVSALVGGASLSRYLGASIFYLDVPTTVRQSCPHPRLWNIFLCFCAYCEYPDGKSCLLLYLVLQSLSITYHHFTFPFLEVSHCFCSSVSQMSASEHAITSNLRSG